MLNKRLIAKIINGEEVVMTIDDNMLSCEFGSLDRGNLTDVVNWGIYANRGSISFIDNLGFFKNYNSIDLKKYIIRFYFKKSSESRISDFDIDEIYFDEQTEQVDIQLVSRLMRLQKEYASYYGIAELPFRETSAYELCRRSWVNESETPEQLKNTIIYCPYHPKKEKSWDRIDKICQATMSRVIEDSDGNPIITGSFPQRSTVVVMPKNILSVSNSSFVRVANASIDSLKREKKFDSTLENVYANFTVNYGEYGELLSVSGGDFEFDKTNPDQKYVTITKVIKTPYKVTRGTSGGFIISTETIEFENNIGQKSTYSTVHYGGGGEFSLYGDDFSEIKITVETAAEIIYRDNEGKVNSSKRLKQVDTKPNTTYAVDNGTETKTKINNDEEDTVSISSNDFIQVDSYYIDNNGDNIPLADYILQEVSRRYSKGIECFEIECLFNDYYDENGNKVFGGEDLSNHFNKYDIIIPYVMKKGNIVPYRVNEDGTPKQFRIIGISYSYDGLLKQKLSVQEERYDTD